MSWGYTANVPPRSQRKSLAGRELHLGLLFTLWKTFTWRYCSPEVSIREEKQLKLSQWVPIWWLNSWKSKTKFIKTVVYFQLCCLQQSDPCSFRKVTSLVPWSKEWGLEFSQLWGNLWRANTPSSPHPRPFAWLSGAPPEHHICHACFFLPTVNEDRAISNSEYSCWSI